MEQKAVFQAELKITPLNEPGPGRLQGYLSTFSNVDSYADTIERGAYAETIPSFLRDGFMAADHSWQYSGGIVGTWLDAREDERGLFVTGEFHSDPDSQKVRQLAVERLGRGKSVGLSIGYEVLEWEFRKVETPVRDRWGDYTDMIRVLKKIKLYEGSIVSVPADPQALVTGAKASPAVSFGAAFEKFLRRLEEGDSFDEIVAELLTQEAKEAGGAPAPAAAPLSLLATHTQAQMAAVLAEAKALLDRRVKEGRTFSTANVAALEGHATAAETIAGGIRTLIASAKRTERADADAEDAKTRGRKLFLEYQRTQARLNGVAA